MKEAGIKKKSNLAKILKITILGILVLAVILLGMGFIYESASYKNLHANYPPHGEMVDLNGHKLHVNIQGSMDDTNFPVVIETGTGNWSYDWIEVQQELAKYTQVLTYDRSGNGWSEPATHQSTIETVLEDMKAVIDHALFNKPVILIGHSSGGLYTRLFAEQYPEYVAGMVLVDARNEYFSDKAKEFNEEFFKTQDQTMMKLISQFGLIRLIGANSMPVNFPASISKKDYVNVHWDHDFFVAVEEEMKLIPEAEKLLMSSNNLGSMPLVVLTPEGYSMPIAQLGFSEEVEKEVNVTWKESQEWLSKLSTNSEYIQVPNVGHSLNYDNPQIIVESVRNLFKKLQSQF